MTVAWFHAVYNGYRIYRHSTATGRVIVAFPYDVADVLGGLRNLEDLSSLMSIHNSLDWTQVHRCMSLHNSRVLY